MALPGGKVVRNFPGRRTVRLELKSATGSPQSIYLKRYESAYLSAGGWLLRWLRWPGAEDEALREWQMIPQVRSLGIRTATPIAVGQERAGGPVKRSFLMTAEIAGATEGHTFVQNLPAAERPAERIRDEHGHRDSGALLDRVAGRIGENHRAMIAPTAPPAAVIVQGRFPVENPTEM